TTDLSSSARILSLIQKSERAALPHLDVIAPFVSCGHRDAATRALGILIVLKPESKRELGRVLALAEDAEPRLRRLAVKAAIRIAPGDGKTVEALEAELARANDHDRESLMRTASEMRPDAPGFAALVGRYAEDPAAKVRVEAARRLKAIALEDRAWLGLLIGMLGDADADVRRSAARSVGEIGSLAAAAVEPLTELLRDRDPTDNLEAVKALTAIGREARSAFPAVLAMLERTSPSREMRDAVIRYIAADPKMTIAALESDEEGPRLIALRILGGWRTEVWGAEILDVLRPLERTLLGLENPDYQATRILEAVGRQAEGDPKVTKFLVALAKARSRVVRDLAGAQLAKRPVNVPLLIELLSSSDEAEREFALNAFRRPNLVLKGPDALDGLWPLLHTDDEVFRSLAARVLIQYTPIPLPADTPAEDVAALARATAGLLDHEEDREQALMRLGSLGSHALPWLDPILALLADRGLTHVKIRAAWALRDIARSGDRARDAVIPKVLDVFRGEDPVAAAAAAHALTAWKEHDELLLRRLPKLIRDPRKTVHFAAISATEAMRERALPLVPLLLEVAESPLGQSHVGVWALNALIRIAPQDERFLRVAVAGLLDPARKDYRTIYQHAMRTGRENAARLLADELEAADAPTKLLLLSSLRELGANASAVFAKVVPLTEDPDPRVAAAAAEVVKRLTPRKPVQQD
ncbi:MAG: HEAT repeat domain-containing protein, partial [Planctomycetota bacterium]